MLTARTTAWLSAVTISVSAGFAYANVTTSFDTPSEWRVVLFLVMGISGLVATFLTPGIEGRFGVFRVIWVPAILFRMALLPTAPSDDINRYLWEGKLVNAGISPYAQLANAPALKEHRDTYWESMNHKDKPTAYPPIVLLIFAGVGAIVYHPLAFKLAFILGDLLTLGGILFLLKRRGLGLWYSGWYSLSPIIGLSYAGEGHFDSLMIAALMMAICAAEKQRLTRAVLLATIASGIKFVTLPLIPFCAGIHLVRGAFVAVLGLLLPLLFFWESLGQLFHGLAQFGGTRSFNGPIYELLLRGFGLPREWCSGLVAICFLSITLWRWFRRRQAPIDSHIRWILGSLLVLSSTVHFWYIAWILPFVCLRPSIPWITFSITGGAYFWVWSNAETGAGWGLLPWQITVFWMPFFIACCYELWSTRGRVLRPAKRVDDEKRSGITIIIPTLNASKELPRALHSIEAQTLAPCEIIIVDAGSTDQTEDCAVQSGLEPRFILSSPGRGNQIAAGIAATYGVWAVVLHSDAVLMPTTLASLRRAVDSDPEILGGAFGQRFLGQRLELTPIELLNDLRGLFTRTAFGDQLQFFHTETARLYSVMPAQPLMEDVESSWRLRELGGYRFLGSSVYVGHQKWRREDWIKRFRLVISLVSRYRWARLQSRENAENLSRSLYDEYYPPKR